MTTPDLSPAPQAPEEDVTTALYRAAIGPVSGDYYLPIFTRFEAADHAGISWNTAASLATLNWLAFRQLWVAALAYVGIVVAVVLLVFGLGRLVFQFSDALTMALGLGFGLAAFVLPGLFGNALLHRECRKRMADALTAHASVNDACTQLRRHASTRRRAIWLAGANLAFLLAAVFSYLQFSALSNLAVMPQGALDAGHVAVGRTVDMAASSPSPLAAVSAAMPVAAPVLEMASAPAVSAAASAPQAAVSAAVAVAAPPAPTASLPLAAAPVVKTTEPTQKASASSGKKAPRTSAKMEAVTVKAAAQERPKKETTKTAKPAAGAKKAASSAADKPFFINVGLFAKPDNAAHAHAKLIAADLPSVTKELKSSKGPLTRVRVGPFASEKDAQAAVEKIKALELDAVIVQP